MSGQVKKLVRCMQAAGSTSLADGSLCLLSEDEGQLVERVFNNEELQNQRFVADGIRANPSASYVASEKKSYVVFTSADNVLRASEFDVDSDEWVETSLDGVKTISLHPQSHVGVALIPGGALVFAQGANGVITSVRFDEATVTWSSGFDVPGEAQLGTPLSVYITDRALAVSFLDPQGGAHCHIRDFETGDWSDKAILNTTFSGAVQSLVISQDTDTGAIEAYLLTQGSVEHVGQDGSRSVLGSVSEGTFVPKSKAESGISISGSNYGNNMINNYGNGYGGRNGGGNGGRNGGGNGCYGGGYGGYTCYRPPVCYNPCW
ncbi:hypothetical protein GGR51DRAFT_527056 [Nemania sp. FL0031]|nr:hypothetical protein GGR51DRAFT_527056 [Nemania sp. FL0031]